MPCVRRIATAQAVVACRACAKKTELAAGKILAIIRFGGCNPSTDVREEFPLRRPPAEPHAVGAKTHIQNLLRLAVEELPHDVARLLGLLRVDPVAAVGDRLEREARELCTDLLEVY